MSYVIHIWQTPIPSSVLQADKICDQLHEKEEPQNPKFIELAKRLTQRYPCRSQMTGDEDDDQGAWHDEPLDGIGPIPVLALGILSDYIVEVMPFVVETANALGLTVYDTQAGECYLPSGQVLTMPGQAPVDFGADVDPERIDSNAQIIKILAEHGAVFFKKYGYKYTRKDDCFVKKHLGFYHKAKLWGGWPGGGVFLTHSIGITEGLHLVTHTHIRSLEFIKPEPALTIELLSYDHTKTNIWPHVPTPYHPQNHSIRVKTVSEIKSAMDKIMTYEEQTFMPLLSEIQTLDDVHKFLGNPAFVQLLNSWPWNFVGQLLTAYLVNVDNLDALIAKIRASIPDHERRQEVFLYFDKTVELIRLEQRSASI